MTTFHRTAPLLVLLVATLTIACAPNEHPPAVSEPEPAPSAPEPDRQPDPEPPGPVQVVPDPAPTQQLQLPDTPLGKALSMTVQFINGELEVTSTTTGDAYGANPWATIEDYQWEFQQLNERGIAGLKLRAVTDTGPPEKRLLAHFEAESGEWVRIGTYIDFEGFLGYAVADAPDLREAHQAENPDFSMSVNILDDAGDFDFTLIDQATGEPLAVESVPVEADDLTVVRLQEPSESVAIRAVDTETGYTVTMVDEHFATGRPYQTAFALGAENLNEDSLFGTPFPEPMPAEHAWAVVTVYAGQAHELAGIGQLDLLFDMAHPCFSVKSEHSFPPYGEVYSPASGYGLAELQPGVQTFYSAVIRDLAPDTPQTIEIQSGQAVRTIELPATPAGTWLEVNVRFEHTAPLSFFGC